MKTGLYTALIATMLGVFFTMSHSGAGDTQDRVSGREEEASNYPALVNPGLIPAAHSQWILYGATGAVLMSGTDRERDEESKTADERDTGEAADSQPEGKVLVGQVFQSTSYQF